MIRALMLLWVSLAVGCGSDPDPQSVSSRRGIKQKRVGSQMASMRIKKDQNEGRYDDSYGWPEREGQSVERADEKDEKKEDRDLGAELRRAVGNPSSCLKEFSSVTPTQISIHVSAVVNGVGRVNRSSVSSGRLSRAELACVEARVNRSSIRPPDSQEAENVSTTISMSYTPPKKVEKKISQKAPAQRPGVVPIDQGEYLQAKQDGTPISGAPFVPPPKPSGQKISGPSGTKIKGPAGTPIGQ